MTPKNAQMDNETAEVEHLADFEETFSLLEETVRKLENGPLSLEDSTLLFEKGMLLAKRCNELLSVTELKITRLQSAFAEQMRFPPETSEPDDEDLES